MGQKALLVNSGQIGERATSYIVCRTTSAHHDFSTVRVDTKRPHLRTNDSFLSQPTCSVSLSFGAGRFALEPERSKKNERQEKA